MSKPTLSLLSRAPMWTLDLCKDSAQHCQIIESRFCYESTIKVVRWETQSFSSPLIILQKQQLKQTHFGCVLDMVKTNICNLLFSALKLQISNVSGCSETLDLHFKMATLCPCVGRDREVNVRDFHSPCAHWRQSTLSTLCPLPFSIQLVNTKVANCLIFYTNRNTANLANWAILALSGLRLKTKL